MTVKYLYFLILFFVAFVICDEEYGLNMSRFRFSTKTPYYFKPVGELNYFNPETFTPRKIWAIYR